MIDAPGRYKISFEEYLADPCPVPSLSRSTIKDLIRCPAKARWNHPRLNPEGAEEKQDAKFDIGTAAHALFLEGLSNAAVIEADDWRTKAAKEARDEARRAGKVPLLAKQYDAVNRMVSAAEVALFNSELALDIRDMDTEQTYIWKEGETWCRARFDAISKDRKIVLDYKTTDASANPDDYSRIAISTGLDVQDAWYRRGAEAVNGIVPTFIFMVQEVNPPYLCSFIALDPMCQDMGRQKVERGLSIWRECMASNHWPGYTRKVAWMEAPAWALSQWEFQAQMMNDGATKGDASGIPF